jgi:hypothetical protein
MRGNATERFQIEYRDTRTRRRIDGSGAAALYIRRAKRSPVASSFTTSPERRKVTKRISDFQKSLTSPRRS